MQSSSNQKIYIVLPAYNAERTLTKVVGAIPAKYRGHLLLVDDASKDNTAAVARGLGIEVIEHQTNLGYGANQKTCYRIALERNADIIVMLHPDGQYNPAELERLIAPISGGDENAVYGSRMMRLQDAYRGGMPVWKIIVNTVLTKLANVLTGKHLSEWHCGYRAYRAGTLRQVNFHAFSQNFSFDTQMTLALLHAGITPKEVAISTHYGEDSSSISFRSSVNYGIQFLMLVARFAVSKRHKRR